MDRIMVWFPSARDDGVFEDLKSRVEAFADAFQDEPAFCDVLIDGRAQPEQLARVRQGGMVIVPFAGVPPATIEVLRTRPDLSLHNLHHNGPETAETTLGLLLAAAKRLHTADRELRKGDWTPRYLPEEMIRLHGKTVLIAGMGSIGRRVAAACATMGMDVIGIRRGAETAEDMRIDFGAGEARIPVRPMAELNSLLPRAHVLILAIPLTSETKDLIGKEEFAALRKPSLFVNAARAQIVKEKELYEALRDGVLHAAGLDVWYRYPKHPEGIVPGFFHMPEEAKHTFPSDYPFHELDNVVLSPHRGGSSREAEEARVEHLAELIGAYAESGEMPNKVDLEAGY